MSQLVTRTLTADPHPDLPRIAKIIGGMRADIWQRFGGLKAVCQDPIRYKSQCSERYKHLNVDGTIRNQTMIDTLNDIKAFREGAKKKVRRAIYRRAEGDDAEVARLNGILNSAQWRSDNFLHRQMRTHFRHGKIHRRNQFVVRSDKHREAVVDGKLMITIHIAAKFGSDITLTTNTSGDGVDLSRKNLRIVLREDHVEIHYAFEKGAGRPCGTQTLGVDKGYSEALVDSDGHFHGRRFGAILRDYTEAMRTTGQARGKLHALVRKHQEQGRHAKAARIKTHNLGRKKLDHRRRRTQKRLRDEAYKAVHAVVNKAAVVASEDLTAAFNRSKPWGRGFNRRMGSWAKGVLAEALESVTAQRSAGHVLVNAAYSSQVSSRTGRLEGDRHGDRFITPAGEVLHSDVNAARNVLSRIDDLEIKRYMPFSEVRAILLRRYSGGELPVKRLELRWALLPIVNQVQIQPSA